MAPDRPGAERGLRRIAGRILPPGVITMDPATQGYVKKPPTGHPPRGASAGAFSLMASLIPT